MSLSKEMLQERDPERVRQHVIAWREQGPGPTNLSPEQYRLQLREALELGSPDVLRIAAELQVQHAAGKTKELHAAIDEALGLPPLSLVAMWMYLAGDPNTTNALVKDIHPRLAGPIVAAMRITPIEET